jgi:hypothetical protein
MERAPSWLPTITAKAKPNSISCACPVVEARAGNASVSPSIANTDAGKTKIA